MKFLAISRKLSALALVLLLGTLAQLPSEREARCDCERTTEGKCSPGKTLNPNNGCCEPVRKAAPSCQPGKIVTQKSAGNCCWPGQSWANGRCSGSAVCPDGFDPDGESDCKPERCAEGQKRPDGIHCCWPGQTWKAGACAGAPQCPAPTEVDGLECVSPDRDSDGIPNKSDRCPTEAEDKDGFEDEDGCPDPDNDKDGIPDARDRCPNQPEDRNGFKDTDGCPDAAEMATFNEEQRKAEEEKERKRKEKEDAAIADLKRQVEEQKKQKALADQKRLEDLKKSQEEALRYLQSIAQPAPTSGPAPTSADRGPKGSPVGFALAIGFGIPASIASLTTGVLAYSMTKDLEEKCPTKVGCDGDKIDSAKSMATIATYTGIAGVGLVTLAILIRPRNQPSVGLRLGPGSALVEGRF